MRKIIWGVVIVVALLAGNKIYHQQKVKMEQQRVEQERKQREEQERTEAEIERNAIRDDEEAIAGLMKRWADQIHLASSTARIALAPQVAPLQAMRTEASNLRLKSKCYAKPFQETLVQAMDEQTEGFLLFMRDSEYLAINHYKLASIAFEVVTDVREHCRAKLAT